MRLIRVDLPSDLDYLELAPLGDWHSGDPLFNRRALERGIAWVNGDPRRRAVLPGDLGNFATRFSKGNVYRDRRPKEQKQIIREIVGSLREKPLVIVPGNHEYRPEVENDSAPIEDIAAEFGIPYAADGAYLRISFGTREKGGKQHYSAYVVHGYGGGRLSGAKLINLERLTQLTDADLTLTGHTHEPRWCDYDLREYDPYHQRLVWRQKVGICCGAWLDYGDYAERGGYRPGPIRLLYARLDANKKHIVPLQYPKSLRDEETQGAS